MREERIKTFDGHEITCYFWDKVKNPKGIVQIVHGLAEHATRYDDFAKFLNKNGFIAFADDHRSHGKTAGDTENIGKYEGGNVFFDSVQDQIFFSKLLKEKYNLPLYIYAHSYGSFLIQSYMEDCDIYDRVILAGCSYMRNSATYRELRIARLTAKFKGENAPAKYLEKVIFSRFNRRIKNGTSWVNSNKDKADEYFTDPLCGKTFSAKFYEDMFSSFKVIFKYGNLDHINKEKPVLLMVGKNDPVTRMGALASKLYKVYKEHDIMVAMKQYEGARHALLHDEVKELVYKDVVEFFGGKMIDSVSEAISIHKNKRKKIIESV